MKKSKFSNWYFEDDLACFKRHVISEANAYPQLPKEFWTEYIDSIYPCQFKELSEDVKLWKKEARKIVDEVYKFM